MPLLICNYFNIFATEKIKTLKTTLFTLLKYKTL